MTQDPYLVTELFCRLPRSKKKRIRYKWLKNERYWSSQTRVATAEEVAEHEEWHRRHGDLEDGIPCP